MKTKDKKMASSSIQDQQASFEELVNCPICMERMQDAKHLQCQHAFCLTCLDDWVKQPDTPKDHICCPVCRQTTPLPKGVGSLPTDINVNRILDLLHEMGPLSDGARVMCEEHGAAACYHCSTCKEDLCTVCFQKHQETTTKHNVETLKRTCKIHPGMAVTVFCLTCKGFACTVCKEHAHRKHHLRSLKDIAKYNRDTLCQLVRNLGKNLSHTQIYSSQVNTGTIEVMYHDTSQAIEAHAQKGIELISKWKENLLQEVRRKRAVALDQASDYESQYAISESLVLYAENKLQGPDYEIVEEFVSLRDGLQQAMKDIERPLTKPQSETAHDAHFLPEPWPSTFGTLGGQKPSPSPSDYTILATTNGDDTFQFVEAACAQPSAFVSPEPSRRSSSSPPKASSSSGGSFEPKPSTSSGPKHPLNSPRSPGNCPPLYPQLTGKEENGAPSPDADSGYSGSDHSAVASPIAASAPSIEASPSFSIGALEYSFNILDDDWTDAKVSFSKSIFPEESFASSVAHAAVNFLSWVSGKQTSGLQCPIDIAADSNKGYLYLLNKESKDVTRFDFPSDLQLHVPQLVMNNVQATALAVSPKDDSIAAASSTHIHFQPRGYTPGITDSLRSTISSSVFFPYTVRSPQAISISKDDKWVILDRRKCLVAIYSHTETLKKGCVFRHVVTFGSDGILPGQFFEPSHLCVDSDHDRIYVTDSGNHRVQAFTLRGAFIWESGKKGSSVGDFDNPQGLCLDDTGNLIVADSGNARLVVLSWQDGKCRKLIDTNKKHLDFISPCGVALLSPKFSNNAYMILAGLRKKGRMPVVSVVKYTKSYL